MSLADCDRISRADPTDPRFALLQNLQAICSMQESHNGFPLAVMAIWARQVRQRCQCPIRQVGQ